MKNSTKLVTTRSSSLSSGSAAGRGSIAHTLRKNLLAVTAVTALFGMTSVELAQAGDISTERRMMRPLYAVSFDVGLKHVVSFFLTKGTQCDLTVLVSDQLEEVAEAREMPSLRPTRIKTLIDTGKKVHIDAAGGRILEYFCLNGSRSMSVREVRQIAYTAGVSR